MPLIPTNFPLGQVLRQTLGIRQPDIPATQSTDMGIVSTMEVPGRPLGSPARAFFNFSLAALGAGLFPQVQMTTLTRGGGLLEFIRVSNSPTPFLNATNRVSFSRSTSEFFVPAGAVIFENLGGQQGEIEGRQLRMEGQGNVAIPAVEGQASFGATQAVQLDLGIEIGPEQWISLIFEPANVDLNFSGSVLLSDIPRTFS